MSVIIEFATDIIKQTAGILLALSPLLSPHIRDIIAKKIQLSFDKALEDKKSSNERKNYISNVRFDKEFEIYQIISEQQISLVYDVGEAVKVARGMYDNEKEEYKKFIEKFCSDVNQADIGLKRYASFISKDIYERYKQLDEICTDIFKLLLLMDEIKSELVTFRYKDKTYNKNIAKQFIEETQKEISDLSDEIIDFVREYLSSLDVL